MTIAEAAKRLGISVSLVRHYEKAFNLQFARNSGGQRIITEQDLQNLRIIRSYRDQHLSIEAIRSQLIATPSDNQQIVPDLKEVLTALIARQDRLEQVVQTQQEAIGQLLGENTQLRLANERIQHLLSAPRDPDPILQQRLQTCEELLAAKDQVAQSDTFKALQRRILDLEAAVAMREEPPRRDEDSLLETLVDAIQQEAKRHRPWWRFWA
ncbi:MAG: MerR family transcriptional regulator [Cyanobacteria bacterium NC_groundwater_1444_Ag_S-0.65um_54_12]|nr:MerR family transcriptional regulator [Cyanobacteria bacterium NC_groundwater_1444_Ag_S-0.65um_54_12]